MINIKKWREECAIFGISGSFEASQLTYLGLYAQQHRGQEATGIICQKPRPIYEPQREGACGGCLYS